MKRILGLDLGTSSIGWAIVDEAEKESEKSSIVRLGVRVNPITVDESQNFLMGKAITTNSGRRIKRSMRRNLQRFKLRREELIKILKDNNIIGDDAILCERGNRSTFETYRLRSEAVEREISLEEFARVLLMLNKKRGYKSSRKIKNDKDGSFLDGMDVAKKLYENHLTPGELCLNLLNEGTNHLPEFYRSDLQTELQLIWDKQRSFYSSLTDDVFDLIQGKNKTQTWAILRDNVSWEENVIKWDEENACRVTVPVVKHLVGIKRETKGRDLKIENYSWRVKATKERLPMEHLAIVIQNINGEISSSSGYLGNIGDRSKELYFNKQTVGQYLFNIIQTEPNTSLKNKVFYRQDYLDEFNTIWEKQSEYHEELTDVLKGTIRDVIIFYQRKLKSQKGLISLCEFESRTIHVSENGKIKTKQIGNRVIPRSSPLFQEFKIWQTLNNVVISSDHSDSRNLSAEEKVFLSEELSIKDSLTKNEVLGLLNLSPRIYKLNFDKISGNSTGYALFSAYSTMMELSGHEPIDFSKSAREIKDQVKKVFDAIGVNSEKLGLSFDSNIDLDKQPYYKLWHLLYSYEGDDSKSGNDTLVNKLKERYGLEESYAKVLASVSFLDDYGSLSAKAISKILPFLKEGNQYDTACLYAGYRHSKSSLTKEEIQNKVLKDKMTLIPKNGLRNPVVEKILNQLVNLTNELIEEYGRPDEVRIELARELKKNAKEREALMKSISDNTKLRDTLTKILQEDEVFKKQHVSKNDVLRLRLYEELKDNGYKTLYSNQYIPKEDIFSNKIDIEHIIPQARLFDDSFSNKTLEYRDVNIRKGNKTAYDFVKEEYGDDALKEYVNRCERLFGDKEHKAKLRKLTMSESEIPEGFVDRDLRNTQYISRMAMSMLSDICRRVVPTTGSITEKLRKDWQLEELMRELNWDKYYALGLTEYYVDNDGRRIPQIKDWSKRNDHRHHAMDALTIAFTKDVFIQYFNNKNASFNPNKNEYDIKNKYFDSGVAISPIPLGEFRKEAKEHLSNILVSFKSKNKVVTRNINKIRVKKGYNEKTQLTPRGQLHLETVYGKIKRYETKVEEVGSNFDLDKIKTVCLEKYRDALTNRLMAFGNDPKKAFTGKNSLEKNPCWIDKSKNECVPAKVKTVGFVNVFTTRKDVVPNLKVDKVIDSGIKRILKERLKEYDGEPKKAFVNLDENPIWLNKEKGIALKRVTISGVANATAIHEKKGSSGELILNQDGGKIPVDYVNTGNNHHAAVYLKPVIGKDGQLVYDSDGSVVKEVVVVIVSFFEAVARANEGLPIIDKNLNSSEGWEFLYSMKQNDMFVFPNLEAGFDPKEIDLMNSNNYKRISLNLYRVQKLTENDYVFRHHLETTVDHDIIDYTFKRIRSAKGLQGIVKVRINHMGEIVEVGE